jgi:cell division septal protein FtsQ
MATSTRRAGSSTKGPKGPIRTDRRRSPALAPDPRISQRRAQVKRSKARRRIWFLSGLLAVVALALGAWALLHTSLFSARSISVVGALHESPAQVVAAAGMASHPPLVSIDAGAAAAKIDALPWVRTSSVSLRWPSSAKIVVHERSPVASVASPGGLLLLDRTGRVLELVRAAPAGMVPVALADAAKLRPGASVGSKELGALEVAGTLPIAFKDQVASVQANADGTVTLHLSTPVSVNLGNVSELLEKYKDVASVIAGTTLHPGDVLDVSVPQASTITGP